MPTHADLLARAAALLDTQPAPGDAIGRATAALALVALAREIRESEVPDRWQIARVSWSSADPHPFNGTTYYPPTSGYEPAGRWAVYADAAGHSCWRRPLRRVQA
jgi:hypothetical protein